MKRQQITGLEVQKWHWQLSLASSQELNNCNYCLINPLHQNYRTESFFTKQLKKNPHYNVDFRSGILKNTSSLSPNLLVLIWISIALLFNLCRQASLLTFYATTVPVLSANYARGRDSISGTQISWSNSKGMLVKKVA